MQEQCRFHALICIESMRALINSAPLDDDRLQSAQPQLGRSYGESAPSHVSKAFGFQLMYAIRFVYGVADVKSEEKERKRERREWTNLSEL